MNLNEAVNEAVDNTTNKTINPGTFAFQSTKFVETIKAIYEDCEASDYTRVAICEVLYYLVYEYTDVATNGFKQHPYLRSQ